MNETTEQCVIDSPSEDRHGFCLSYANIGRSRITTELIGAMLLYTIISKHTVRVISDYEPRPIPLKKWFDFENPNGIVMSIELLVF